MAPIVTTISIILSSNGIQNGDILVRANPGPPGKWLLKYRERMLCIRDNVAVTILLHKSTDAVTMLAGHARDADNITFEDRTTILLKRSIGCMLKPIKQKVRAKITQSLD